MDDQTKLNKLLEIQGMDEDQFIEDYICECCVPAICMNEGCDATYEYEPDQDKGWCEECGTGTVKSGLMLAGII